MTDTTLDLFAALQAAGLGVNLGLYWQRRVTYENTGSINLADEDRNGQHEPECAPP